MDRNDYTKLREILSHIPNGKGNKMFLTSSVFNNSIQSLIRGAEPSVLLYYLSNIIEKQNKELERLYSNESRTHVVINNNKGQ